MLSRIGTRLFLLVGAVLLASGLGIAQLNEPTVSGLDLHGSAVLLDEQQIFGYQMAAVGLVLTVGAAAFLWGRAGRRTPAARPRRKPVAASRTKKAPARRPSRR